MKLYSENKEYKLYQGNMLDMLEHIALNSVDSIVTDPPYELNFMGKGWDNAGVSFNKDTWKKCFDVLKPGGYLLAFGGSRTYHRIACAIEDAGFEIRDTIMWLYGSGFPKSMNIGLAIDKKNGVDNRTGNMKHDGGQGGGVRCFSDDNYEWKKDYEERVAQNEWKGWGTCLKPSYEPIIIARKPFDGTLVDNVLTYGVGGLNIDECRIPLEEGFQVKTTNRKSRTDDNVFDDSNSGIKNESNHIASADPNGRFPANTILTYDETDYDEVCGGFPCGGKNGSISKPYKMNNTVYGEYGYCNTWTAYDDSGSASRYFYCAKASKKDRNEGLDNFEDKFKPAVEYRPFLKREAESGATEHNDFLRLGKVKNNHPTVKPCDLMQYLVRLVTPNGGTVLDPFNGSGSTGKAVMYENRERGKGYKYIGIELTEEYLPIAKARIEYAQTSVVSDDVITNTPKETDSGVSVTELW